MTPKFKDSLKKEVEDLKLSDVLSKLFPDAEEKNKIKRMKFFKSNLKK